MMMMTISIEPWNPWRCSTVKMSLSVLSGSVSATQGDQDIIGTWTVAELKIPVGLGAGAV
jgi:hypothetical protein